MMFPENGAGRKGTYTHDLFTKAALNFIKINKPDYHNKYRPFFLFLAYTIPHANNEEGRRVRQRHAGAHVTPPTPTSPGRKPRRTRRP